MAVVGHGIDIVEIARIEKLLADPSRTYSRGRSCDGAGARANPARAAQALRRGGLPPRRLSCCRQGAGHRLQPRHRLGRSPNQPRRLRLACGSALRRRLRVARRLRTAAVLTPRPVPSCDRGVQRGRAPRTQRREHGTKVCGSRNPATELATLASFEAAGCRAGAEGNVICIRSGFQDCKFACSSQLAVYNAHPQSGRT